MAEALFRSNDQIRTRGIVVHSAGLHATDGHHADKVVTRLLAERDIDVSAHRSRLITAEMVQEAQLVLVMEERQIREVAEVDSSSRGKVHLLGKWLNVEIYDPYRQAESVYRGSAELVEQSVENWIKKIC